MRKKVKLIFEALERELSQISSSQMLNVIGGNGDPYKGDIKSLFLEYQQDLAIGISVLVNSNTPLNSSQQQLLSDLQQMHSESLEIDKYLRDNNKTLSINTTSVILSDSKGLFFSNTFKENNDGFEIGIIKNFSIDDINNGNPTNPDGYLDDFAHDMTHLYKNIKAKINNTTSPYNIEEEREAYRRERIYKLGVNAIDLYVNPSNYTAEINSLAQRSYKNYLDQIGLPPHTEYPVTTIYEEYPFTTIYEEYPTTTIHE